MESRFSFKHMKSSQAVIDYADSKLIPKINKFSTKPIDFHVTFGVDQKQHWAHCGIKGGDGFSFEVDARSGDMYASIDLLAEKLETKLKKQKEKLKRHKFHSNLKTLTFEDVGSKDDWDTVEVDAADLVKFERARHRAFG